METTVSAFARPQRSCCENYLIRNVSRLNILTHATGGLNSLYHGITTGASHSPLAMTTHTDSDGHFIPVPLMELASRYRVLSCIEASGQSAVLIKAEDYFCTMSLVVIKVMHTSYLAVGLKEVQTLRKLNSMDPKKTSHTVHLLNSFRFKDHICLVFPLLNPLPLIDVIAKKHLCEEEILSTVRKISLHLLSALAFLRSQNIIHADIKPENILLEKDGDIDTVTLIDFGNAIYLTHNEVSLYYTDFELQTQPYRAPEVHLGIPFGLEVDMWSLGCVLLELLTGQLTFVGIDRIDSLQKMVSVLGPLPAYMCRRGKFFFEVEPALMTTRRTYRAESGAVRLMSAFPDIKNYEFFSFLSGMLTYNPDMRMTPWEALQHPFMAPLICIPHFLPGAALNSGVVRKSDYNFRQNMSTNVRQLRLSTFEMLRVGTGDNRLLGYPSATFIEPLVSRLRNEDMQHKHIETDCIAQDGHYISSSVRMEAFRPVGLSPPEFLASEVIKPVKYGPLQQSSFTSAVSDQSNSKRSVSDQSRLNHRFQQNQMNSSCERFRNEPKSATLQSNHSKRASLLHKNASDYKPLKQFSSHGNVSHGRIANQIHLSNGYFTVGENCVSEQLQESARSATCHHPLLLATDDLAGIARACPQLDTFRNDQSKESASPGVTETMQPFKSRGAPYCGTASDTLAFPPVTESFKGSTSTLKTKQNESLIPFSQVFKQVKFSEDSPNHDRLVRPAAKYISETEQDLPSEQYSSSARNMMDECHNPVDVQRYSNNNNHSLIKDHSFQEGVKEKLSVKNGVSFRSGRLPIDGKHAVLTENIHTKQKCLQNQSLNSGKTTLFSSYGDVEMDKAKCLQRINVQETKDVITCPQFINKDEEVNLLESEDENTETVIEGSSLSNTGHEHHIEFELSNDTIIIGNNSEVMIAEPTCPPCLGEDQDVNLLDTGNKETTMDRRGSSLSNTRKEHHIECELPDHSTKLSDNSSEVAFTLAFKGDLVTAVNCLHIPPTDECRNVELVGDIQQATSKVRDEMAVPNSRCQATSKVRDEMAVPNSRYQATSKVHDEMAALNLRFQATSKVHAEMAVLNLRCQATSKVHNEMAVPNSSCQAQATSKVHSEMEGSNLRCQTTSKVHAEMTVPSSRCQSQTTSKVHSEMAVPNLKCQTTSKVHSEMAVPNLKCQTSSKVHSEMGMPNLTSQFSVSPETCRSTGSPPSGSIHLFAGDQVENHVSEQEGSRGPPFIFRNVTEIREVPIHELTVDLCNFNGKCPQRCRNFRRAKQLLSAERIKPETKQLLNEERIKPETKQLLNAERIKPETKQLLNAERIKPETKQLLNAERIKPETKQHLNTERIKPETKQLLNAERIKPETKQLLNAERIKPETKQLLNAERIKPETKTERLLRETVRETEKTSCLRNEQQLETDCVKKRQLDSCLRRAGSQSGLSLTSLILKPRTRSRKLLSYTKQRVSMLYTNKFNYIDLSKILGTRSSEDLTLERRGNKRSKHIDLSQIEKKRIGHFKECSLRTSCFKTINSLNDLKVCHAGQEMEHYNKTSRKDVALPLRRQYGKINSQNRVNHVKESLCKKLKKGENNKAIASRRKESIKSLPRPGQEHSPPIKYKRWSKRLQTSVPSGQVSKERTEKTEVNIFGNLNSSQLDASDIPTPSTAQKGDTLPSNTDPVLNRNFKMCVGGKKPKHNLSASELISLQPEPLNSPQLCASDIPTTSMAQRGDTLPSNTDPVLNRNFRMCVGGKKPKHNLSTSKHISLQPEPLNPQLRNFSENSADLTRLLRARSVKRALSFQTGMLIQGNKKSASVGVIRPLCNSESSSNCVDTEAVLSQCDKVSGLLLSNLKSSVVIRKTNHQFMHLLSASGNDQSSFDPYEFKVTPAKQHTSTRVVKSRQVKTARRRRSQPNARGSNTNNKRKISALLTTSDVSAAETISDLVEKKSRHLFRNSSMSQDKGRPSNILPCKRSFRNEKNIKSFAQVLSKGQLVQNEHQDKFSGSVLPATEEDKSLSKLVESAVSREQQSGAISEGTDPMLMTTACSPRDRSNVAYASNLTSTRNCLFGAVPVISDSQEAGVDLQVLHCGIIDKSSMPSEQPSLENMLKKRRFVQSEHAAGESTFCLLPDLSHHLQLNDNDSTIHHGSTFDFVNSTSSKATAGCMDEKSSTADEEVLLLD